MDILEQNLRDMNIEDLLGRNKIELDNDVISNLINQKTILVTGAGSIGSELCRQIIKYNPKELVIIDIYENNLYDIEMELKIKYPDITIIPLLANIRDFKRVEEIFEKYRPYLVFHAAAHKHVPLLESNPIEAIKNNVFGTYNIVQASDKYEVKRFMFISTDKAVNPSNIMGATKRICEMIIQSKNKTSKTEFVAVRFGNVLNSNGSVVPLFKKQILTGGPVTVTHKDITRFFMTIPEAVSLILQATTYAEGGEIFALNMGKQIKIYDLAINMIKLVGLVPEKDIKIQITGLRPGEKLHEELLFEDEKIIKTQHNKIFKMSLTDIDTVELNKNIEKLANAIKNADVEKEDIQLIIEQIVKTYHY